MNQKEQSESLARANKALDKYNGIALDYQSKSMVALTDGDTWKGKYYDELATGALELVQVYKKKVDRLTRW